MNKVISIFVLSVLICSYTTFAQTPTYTGGASGTVTTPTTGTGCVSPAVVITAAQAQADAATTSAFCTALGTDGNYLLNSGNWATRATSGGSSTCTFVTSSPGSVTNTVCYTAPTPTFAAATTSTAATCTSPARAVTATEATNDLNNLCSLVTAPASGTTGFVLSGGANWLKKASGATTCTVSGTLSPATAGNAVCYTASGAPTLSSSTISIAANNAATCTSPARIITAAEANNDLQTLCAAITTPSAASAYPITNGPYLLKPATAGGTCTVGAQGGNTLGGAVCYTARSSGAATLTTSVVLLAGVSALVML